MISASAVTTRHELIMSLVAGLSLIMQGVKPNGQPPRIQVALATGKLVSPEQGCLGQGGCASAISDCRNHQSESVQSLCKVFR